MTSGMEQTPPSGELDRINQEGAQSAQETLRQLCDAMIRTAYDGVAYYLEIDRDTFMPKDTASPTLATIKPLYVVGGHFNAPREDGEYVSTYSVRLEPKNNSDIDLAAAQGQYIRLHLPTDGANLAEFQMPDRQYVDQIFLEQGDAENIHWYNVNRFGLHEYIPYILQEEDVSILDDRGIWRWINERVPEGLRTISDLYTDVVNWDTVPQRNIETVI